MKIDKFQIGGSRVFVIAEIGKIIMGIMIEQS